MFRQYNQCVDQYDRVDGAASVQSVLNTADSYRTVSSAINIVVFLLLAGVYGISVVT